MAIADALTVRAKAGGRTTSTVPDTLLNTIIEQTDAYVKMYTRKYDWVSTDNDWHVIKRASELLASADIRKMFNDKDEEADEQRKEAMRDLDVIVNNSIEAGRPTVIRKRAYITWPASPTGLIYFNDGIEVDRAAEGLDAL